MTSASPYANTEFNLKHHYFSLLIKQKGWGLLGIFLAVVTAYSGIALLAVSGWFISAAGLAGLSALVAHQFDFFTPGALVRGLSMARTAGRYGERITSHEATFRVISHLRSDLFRWISRHHWSEIRLDRHESASRLMQDIQKIESIYLSALLPAIVAIASGLGYLFVLWLVLPTALVFALVALLLTLLLIPWLYSRHLFNLQNQLHTQRAQQWQNSSAMLSSLRTLTLHERLSQVGEQLVEQGQQADLNEVATVNRQQTWLLLSDLILIALTLVTLWLSFQAWQAEQLQAANLFMLLLLTLGTADVIKSISPALADWQLGISALDRLQSNLGSQSQFSDRSDSVRTFDAKGDIPGVQLKQLQYRYPAVSQQSDNPALFDAFDYVFQGPDWYWITGASGRGKSTLIALLAGQLSPQQGEIRFSGLQPKQLRLMPQRIDILKSSLRDNLSFNRLFSDEELIHALSIVELKDWAESLPNGLDTWLGDGEWQPSGGEAKRIGLARILLMKPSIILLDEPAAGMDSELAKRVFKRLAEQWQHQLVIANTHDLNLIQTEHCVLNLDLL